MTRKTVKCEACKGEGFTIKIDIMKGRSTRETCNICHGRGETYEKQLDGFQIGRMLGESYMFRMLKDGAELSRIETRVYIVLGPTGVPLAKHNPSAIFKRDKSVPRMYCAITRVSKDMQCVEVLVRRASEDPKIEWIEMDEYDAQCYGCAQILESIGFKKEGLKLIKELFHDNKENQDGSAGGNIADSIPGENLSDNIAQQNTD